jgi:NTP pyrophosphatase (non-canonical NTP hydrolase)
MTDSLTFAELRRAAVARQAEWDPHGRAETSLAFRAVELAEEAGEVCGAVKNLLREELNLPGSRSSIEHLAAELADTVIVADLLAAQAGIDLAEAISTTFNAKSKQLGFQTLIAPGRLLLDGSAVQDPSPSVNDRVATGRDS